MTNVITSSLKRIHAILSPSQRRRGNGVLVLLVLLSLLDLLSLGSIIPILPLLLEPNALEAHAWLGNIAAKMGIADQQQFLVVFLLAALGFFTIKNLFGLWVNHVQARFSFDIYTDVTSRLLNGFYRKGYLYFKARSSPELLRDVTSNSVVFAQNLLIPLLLFINETIVLGIMFGVLLYVEPRAIFLLATVLVPPFLLFYMKARHQTVEIRKDINHQHAQIHRTLFQAIYGFIDVRMAGAEAFFLGRYRKEAGTFAKLMTKFTVLNLIPTRLLEVTIMFGALSLVGYMLFFVPNASARITLLGAFGVAAYRSLPSINRMTIALMSVKSHGFALDNAEQLAQLDTRPWEISRKKDLLTLDDGIAVQDLVFQYPTTTRPALNHVSFNVKNGEFIGIVGESGAGKSTLLNVLLGFIQPTNGQILVDGTPLNEANMRSWHHILGYVQQEVYIMEGTLADNIAFGCPAPAYDLKKIEEAARQARLWSFIEGLKHGLSTQVGETGSLLSVGQKQRVGIARALYAGAQLLVFDEPTAALDPDTEKDLTQTLRALADDGCAVLMVTHRPAPLTACDRVLKLEHGKIVERVELSA